MAKPYSDDLRERAVAAIESGHTREEVAELYNLALSTVGGFIRRWHACRPTPRARARARRVVPISELVFGALTQNRSSLEAFSWTCRHCPAHRIVDHAGYVK